MAIPGAKRRLCVLVVDDSGDALWAMNALIKSFGHDVTVARTGNEAITLLEKVTPDIVFMDIKLSDMNGYELARRVRGLPNMANAKLYALTGILGEEFRHKSLSEGFHGHYAKPLDPEMLERLLASLQEGAGH